MNGNPRKRRDDTPQGQADEVPEPQIFRSRLFRGVTWAVLVLLAVSVVMLVVMTLLPLN